MGINNEGIVNRRQLLVRAGSFMKLSMRKSRGLLIDDNEDDDKENSDNSNLRQRGGRKKRNLSVRFSDNLHIKPSNRDGPMSDEEIENRWYQSCDYSRFKKDQILSSLNYINAKRASKPVDETVNCIRGIEDMCITNPAIRRRYIAERKYVFKVIREEQARQKKEWQQQQQNQTENSDDDKNNNNKNTSSSFYPDLEKFRAVSVVHTKGGRDRALARGNEYARAQQRSLGLGGLRNSSHSMKNLFGSFRTLTPPAAA